MSFKGGVDDRIFRFVNHKSEEGHNAAKLFSSKSCMKKTKIFFPGSFWDKSKIDINRKPWKFPRSRPFSYISITFYMLRFLRPLLIERKPQGASFDAFEYAYGFNPESINGPRTLEFNIYKWTHHIFSPIKNEKAKF